MTQDASDDTDVFERAEGAEPTAQEPRWIDLPPTGMLSVEDVDALLRWRRASIVAIVGERFGGKTTLVTEIYERFMRGPFAGALFAHSMSLMGFERKSYLSRADSGEIRPDTPRTSKSDGLLFFHLAVAEEDDLRRTDLLFSERAGEVYREVRNKPASASDLLEVGKAQSIALIIDGQRVAQDLRRAEVFASVRSILRALSDQRMVRADARVQLVTTKYDQLTGDEASDARNALQVFEEQMIGTYQGRFFEIEAFRTAARDPRGVLEPAMGLSPLLRTWLKPPPPFMESEVPLPDLESQFDRLMLRRSA